ncbi:MAG: 5-formyltetrahydrofolate cyclo-ligase [Atopobiaceae bacterium]|jgi:5-formyltetrahydrofolate cyclo-ligase|nr:5-formyltetrahydrofolate cyclo-ligase [Atopobiaceae bacterium]MDO4403437.1 5-formyltetrahydrofolate cyclo-ligase [Atopobiaceae bacterium]
MASTYGEDASKSALRSAYQAAEAKLAPAHAERVDREARMHFTAMAAYRKAPLILAYITYRNEMDTTEVIRKAWKDGKRVAVPVCNKGKLDFYEINSLEGLRIGARGVLEPDPSQCKMVDDKELEGSICLVPGLVFDAQGYRIGYGAGYYDNFLATYPGLKVGLVRTLRISSNPLPHDDHDVPMDVLVSDGSIWQCSRGEVVPREA